MNRYHWLALLAIVFLLCISGCEEPIPEDPPSLVSINVEDGWVIPSNMVVNVEFNKEMKTESVAIELDGVPVHTNTYDGKIFSFIPGKEGKFVLSIAGKDIYGQVLNPPYKPIILRVTCPDLTSPWIVDDQCDPKNGITDLDPLSYSGKIIIAFSEPMSEVNIAIIEPYGFGVEHFSVELSSDRKALYLSSLGWGLGNGLTLRINVTGADMVGNSMKESEYSLATKILGDTPVYICMEEITLKPFEEVSFKFSLLGKYFCGPSLQLDVLGTDLVEGQVFINGHDMGKGNRFIIPEDEWHTKSFDELLWMEILNLEGDNDLLIRAKDGVIKIRNIQIREDCL